MRHLLGALRLAPILAVLPFALHWRTPPFANHRLAALALLLAVPCVVLALELRVLRRWHAQPRLARALSVATATLALAALLITASYEAHFRWVRHDVLRADPARLAPFGRHILVGYRDMAEISALVERGAVAGIFLSGRNVIDRSTTEIRAEIEALQEIRRRGLPPLLIAADQEGGLVSRPVVDGLVRTKWGFPSVLITDDFSMGAVQRVRGGVGAAGVEALMPAST